VISKSWNPIFLNFNENWSCIISYLESIFCQANSFIENHVPYSYRLPVAVFFRHIRVLQHKKAKQVFAKRSDRARLLRAEARLDQLCLALRACLAHRPPPPAAPARRQAPKLIV